MSAINLDVQKIGQIENEMDALNSLLLNNYFPNISSELDAILNNVQSDELHNIVIKLKEHIISLNEIISSESVKLNDFLEEQIKSYSYTETELEEELTSVLQKMLGVLEKNTVSSEPTKKAGVGDYIKTLLLSAGSKFLDLGEGFVDSHIYGTGLTLKLFGVNDQWAKDAIGYEVIDYDKWVTDVSPDVAYGWAHNVGDFGGNLGGYAALSFIPYVGTAACAIAGAGTKTEDSINEQRSSTGKVNDLKVFGDSLVGSAEGYASGQVMKMWTKPKTGASGEIIKDAKGKTVQEFIGQPIVDKGDGNLIKGIGRSVQQSWKDKGLARDMKNFATGYGKSVATDSRAYIRAGAEATKVGLSEVGGYEEKFDTGAVLKTTLPNTGVAGIGVSIGALK